MRFRPPLAGAATRAPAGRAGLRRAVATLAIVLASLAAAGCQPGAPVQPRPAPVDGSGDGRGRPARDRVRLGEPVEARLQHVQDGDSFVAIGPGGERLTVRLAGIDAPERSQPHADVARRRLRALLDGQRLNIRPIKVDAYGRLVAQVSSGDGAASTDIALAQLEAGLAWYFERYERDLAPADRSRYRAAAQAARQAGRGLWSIRDPEAPWAFRARNTAPR